MAQLNTYRVARAGTQFGKHKSKVTLADTHGAPFVRSGDLELLEENVIAEDAPARPAADAAALKDQIASLTAKLDAAEGQVSAAEAATDEAVAAGNVLERALAILAEQIPDEVEAARKQAEEEAVAVTDDGDNAVDGPDKKKG